MDTEKALIEAGYNVSTAEGEFNQQDFPVVAYGEGDDLELEGAGVLNLSWVEPDPPLVEGSLQTTVPIFVVGHDSGTDPDVNAKVEATLEALNVEAMKIPLEGEETKVWRCRARYTWESDFDW